MNTIEIFDSRRGKTIYKANWPSKWEELTQKDFIRVVKSLFEHHDKDSARSWLTYRFLSRPRISLQLSYGEAFELGDTLRFLFQENPITRKFFIPRMMAGFAVMRGPDDNFVKMKAWQFAIAEIAFERAAKNPEDIELLKRLAACIYTTQWQSFSDDNIEGNAKWMRYVSADKLRAIFFNYMMVRGALAKQYPHVFSGGKEKTKNKFGWPGIIQKLPGDVFGTLDKRANEPLHNVLMHLEMSAIEAKELEENLPKK